MKIPKKVVGMMVKYQDEVYESLGCQLVDALHDKAALVDDNARLRTEVLKLRRAKTPPDAAKLMELQTSLTTTRKLADEREAKLNALNLELAQRCRDLEHVNGIAEDKIAQHETEIRRSHDQLDRYGAHTHISSGNKLSCRIELNCAVVIDEHKALKQRCQALESDLSAERQLHARTIEDLNKYRCDGHQMASDLAARGSVIAELESRIQTVQARCDELEKITAGQLDIATDRVIHAERNLHAERATAAEKERDAERAKNQELTNDIIELHLENAELRNPEGDAVDLTPEVLHDLEESCASNRVDSLKDCEEAVEKLIAEVRRRRAELIAAHAKLDECTGGPCLVPLVERITQVIADRDAARDAVRALSNAPSDDPADLTPDDLDGIELSAGVGDYGNREAGDQICQLVDEVRRRRAAMHETSATITEWANATFGETPSNRSLFERALTEWKELQIKLEERDDHPGIPEEIADIAIVFARTMTRFGTDLNVQIYRKMAINRKRRWQLTGDGHGQHIAEPDTEQAP